MLSIAKRRDTVLVVAHTTTFLTELAPFGDLIRQRTSADVVFYCPFDLWSARQFAEACASKGVICLQPPLYKSLGSAGLGNPREWSLIRKARNFAARQMDHVAEKLPGLVTTFLVERLSLARSAADIRALLAAVKPKLIVLGGDMAGYDTPLYIKLARRSGIPTLIVPSTMSNGDEQAEIYYDDAKYHARGLVGRAISKLFPKWVRTHKGVRLFRCPPGRILAMELMGLAPPQPWIFNSGYADAIAMESRAMIEYYAKAGMSGRRMVLTGSLSDESMARRQADAATVRQTLCDELGFDPEHPLVLAALPPDMLYLPGGRPQCEFKTFDDLVSAWVESLAQLKDCNVVVALHPSILASEMKRIERPNLRIGPWRTAEMVPACDIYVASASSTIRWAIACGKPVVNYDVYRYRWIADFGSVSGVLATEKREEFRTLLQRLIQDAAFRCAITQKQVEESERWGMLDGKVGDRMLALVGQISGIG